MQASNTKCAAENVRKHLCLWLGIPLDKLSDDHALSWIQAEGLCLQLRDCLGAEVHPGDLKALTVGELLNHTVR